MAGNKRSNVTRLHAGPAEVKLNARAEAARLTAPEIEANTDAMETASLLANLTPQAESSRAIANFVVAAEASAAAFRNAVGIDADMVSAMYAYAGSYTPEQKAALADSGEVDVYMPVTQMKARTYQAWVRDVVAAAGDDLFNINPTPVTDLPPAIKKAVMDATINALKTSQDPAVAGAAMSEFSAVGTRHARAAAKSAARKMQAHLRDQLEQSGFQQAMLETHIDLSHLPYMVMRGPYMATRSQLTYSEDGGVVEKDMAALDFARVAPWDFFLAPRAKDVEHADYVIERRFVTPSEMADIRKIPGVSEDAVVRVISGNASQQSNIGHYVRQTTSLGGTAFISDNMPMLGVVHNSLVPKIYSNMMNSGVDLLHMRGNESAPRPRWTPFGESAGGSAATGEVDGEQYKITVFLGKVSNKLLAAHGITLSGRAVAEDHTETEIWVCNGEVLRAVTNPYPEGRRPYGMLSYLETTEHGYGHGLAKIMEGVQAKANITLRGIAANIPKAARPTAIVEAARILNFDSHDAIVSPGAVIETTPGLPGMQSGTPVKFLYQPSIVAQLENSLRETMRLADEVSSIPSYAAGLPATSGAGRTSSGLSMLMGASKRGVKETMFRHDTRVLAPILKLAYAFAMRYSADKSLKVDAQVEVRGARGVLERETHAAVASEALLTAVPLVGAGVVTPEEVRELFFMSLNANGITLKTDPQVGLDAAVSAQLNGIAPAAAQQPQQPQQPQQLQQPQQPQQPQQISGPVDLAQMDLGSAGGAAAANAIDAAAIPQ